MKLTLVVDIDDSRVQNGRDAYKIINLVALDIHQGRTGGFIRNPTTGEEHDRWELHVEKSK